MSRSASPVSLTDLRRYDYNTEGSSRVSLCAVSSSTASRSLVSTWKASPRPGSGSLTDGMRVHCWGDSYVAGIEAAVGPPNGK